MVNELFNSALSKKDFNAIDHLYRLARAVELKNEPNSFTFNSLVDEPLILAMFNQSTLFVFEEDETIKGFTGYVYDYIAWLYVHPDFHRQKIGRRLLDYLLEQLQGKSIRISVVKSNQAALACYTQLGFHPLEQVALPYQGHSIDSIRMLRKAS